jgi:hypothetical protein
MKWLRRLIRKWAGSDRYHEQANRVQDRQLRAELLSKRLDVVRRGK